MRVLFLTYDHPFRNRSGVAAYCRDLLQELAGRGIEVVHLYSCERGWTPGLKLRQWTEGGVRFAAVVNSPAPPALSPERPLQDCGHSGLERLLAGFLRDVRPDVVHVHTLMGFTGSVVQVAKRLGFPVVLTLHDFWPLCARVSLVRPDGTACTGPEGGVNCARFCAGKDSLRRRAYRRLIAALPRGTVRRAVEGGAELYLRARARSPQEGQARSHRVPRLQEARAHGERARRLLQDLLAADRLLAVSHFVREAYARHGIPQDRITVLPLGLALTDQVRWRVRTARHPVRFGYLGRLSPLKGAHLLAQAAGGVPADSARFLFFGPGGPALRAELQRLAGNRPLEFRGPYRREDLPRVLEEIDVAVVPTLFQETVGLTALEPQAAGIPVIASAAGALPEWVAHEHNGLLFPPGDGEALRRLILRVVEDPELVSRLSAQTRPPRSMADHAEELLDIYAQCRRACRV
ncbi:MAG: glycosyltransferase family 4 protein [Armatimonadetes bacterium]|nr:glycosyltransferase family 4 protein [Armatimonadota bacterium]MDW8153892.1 glycosyltransferase family 4 protein [Armatimonadota bacterium]